VIGDLAGFAAAILRRGVDYVQIPTTLLAQVDSSVGGKTAIDTKDGKNLVGAFHQPRLVLADIDLLDSLPQRELLAGYAEVAKYGLLGDANFFAWLEANGAALLAGDKAARRRAVAMSVAAKARIVEGDERETGGGRALLNLGHTFAHALETEAGFGDDLRHGEAVAIGMVLAFELSARLGHCPAADAARVRRHLAAVGLPVSPRVGNRWPEPAALIRHMGQDKKVAAGRLTFVLAGGIGRAFLTREVSEAALTDLLAAARAA
jgi:3-dehydroquinate synthase